MSPISEVFSNFDFSACAVQSAFGIFVVVMIVEMMIMAVVWISICCSAKSDRYRVNMVGHASCREYFSFIRVLISF